METAGMDTVAVVAVALLGLVVGSLGNRLVVAEPGYVITDPGDLPEDADPALLDELEPEPTDLPAVPVLALLRPGTWWRRWFPLTEVAMAGLFALVASRIASAWVAGAVLVLVAALVTLSTVDFRVYRIPDRINFPSMGIGLAAIVVASLAEGVPRTIPAALAGGVIYAGMLFVAHLVSPRGMGWGDVKLAWLMGFYLGWVGYEPGGALDLVVGALREVLQGAAIGSVLGVVSGGTYAVIRRSAKAVFPYGPSLALGCIIAVLF